MSLMPRQIPIRRLDIGRLETVGDVRRWLEGFVKELDLWYTQLYNHIESGGFETKTWRVKEANAQDVTDGNAAAVGDLMFQHKVSGIWSRGPNMEGS